MAAPILDCFAVVAPGRLEEGQEVGHAEQISNLLARVYDFQLAASCPCGHIQAHHRAKTRTVHLRYFLQIDHDSLVARDPFAHGILQHLCVLKRELSMAFRHQRIFMVIAMHAKSSGRTAG
jgi:hypothetical protein